MMDEDTWEWTDKVRKKLHPRRGGVEAKFRKVMKPRAAFKALAKAYVGHLESGVSKAKMGPAYERLSCVPKDAPELLSPEDEARMLEHFFTMAFGAEMVDFWIGQGTPTFALRALIAAHKMSNYDRAGWYTQTHCLSDAWTRFRARLSVAEAPEYESALALARSLWKEAPFEEQLRLAYAFPAQQEWAHEVADRYVDRPKTRMEFLYHSLTDPKRLNAILDRSVWWETGIFFSFVEGTGHDALESLVPLFDKAKKTPQRKIVYEALAIIPSDDAMLALLEREGDRAMLPFLTSASMRWPTRAERLLRAALAKKKSATLASLLNAVENVLS
ncbi:MAG: hypothetical protein AB8H86_30555 [Polyangiales bacterium]